MQQRTFRYLEVADSLRAQIDSGDFGSHGMLPSEASLSAEHETSRVTVRKALEQLRSEGLIGSRQGLGWFVGAEPVRQSLGALDTLEHQLAAAGISSEREVLAFGFLPAPEIAADSFGDQLVLGVERLIRADGEPFALVTVWCDAVAAAEISRAHVERSSFQELLAGQVGGAAQTIAATVATDELAAKLSVPEGSPLLRIRRVTQRIDGSDLLVSEHLYPAHRMEFSVELLSQEDIEEPRGLRLVQP